MLGHEPSTSRKSTKEVLQEGRTVHGSLPHGELWGSLGTSEPWKWLSYAELYRKSHFSTTAPITMLSIKIPFYFDFNTRTRIYLKHLGDVYFQC